MTSEELARLIYDVISGEARHGNATCGILGKTSVQVDSPFDVDDIGRLLMNKIVIAGMIDSAEFHSRVTYTAGQKQGEQHRVIVTVR